MTNRDSMVEKAAFWATFWAVALSVVSIAASQILLGVALLALIGLRRKPQLPVYILPLSLYVVGTLIAGIASGFPMLGMPQYKKFFVFLILICVANTFRTAKEVRWLLLAVIAAASASGVWGLEQYWRKWTYARAHGLNFSITYIVDRITGFMSHWMTFSGHMMIALLALVAFLFFAAKDKKDWRWMAPAGLVLGTALILAQTRAMWIGAAAGLIYLAWQRDKRLVLTLPVLAGVLYVASPENVQQRMVSIVHERGQVDSNSHRKATWAIGWEIVKAHPITGIGPQMVKYRYNDWVPAWLRPLPEGYYEHLHNIYFQTAAERGVPTLLMLLWMIAWILRDAWRGLKALPAGPCGERFALHAILAIMISILVSGLLENNLGDSEVLMLFLGISQCVYAVIPPAIQKS